MKVRTRFAPSPTGFMHIGNLRTALYEYLYAKKHDGEFILRIEDTDQERLVDGAINLIYNTLKSCGINYDEGPDIGGDYGPYIQSERRDIYKKYAEELVKLKGAYYCFCDKDRLDELADDKGVKKYDKHCLKLTDAEIKDRLQRGDKYVIRQNIPLTGISEYEDLVFGNISINCEDMEDNVLLKSDGFPTYNFANVVDDHLMKITHVIRGSEYLSSTPKYNLIYDSFGWQRPIYVHLPPIMKDEKRKLSKRYGDANFEDFIEKGYLKEAIINYISLLGWSPKNNREKFTLKELENSFNVEGISKSGSIFDENKLKWLNQEYIKDLSIEEFTKIATPFYEKSKICGKYDYNKLSELLISRVSVLSEISLLVDFLEEFDCTNLNLYSNAKMKTDANIAKLSLECILNEMSLFNGEWNKDNIHDFLIPLCEKIGLKKGQLLWCFRISITAKESTPGGAMEMAEIIGKERCIERMKLSLKYINECTSSRDD